MVCPLGRGAGILRAVLQKVDGVDPEPIGRCLFAALSVLEGKVIGRCVPRHRHQEFIRFIATVERSVPAGKVIDRKSTRLNSSHRR